MKPRSRRVLATSVVVGLVLVGAADVWSMIANLHRASLVGGFDYADPATISLTAANNADHQVRASGITYVILFLLAGALFIAWLHRIVSDLHDLRPTVPTYSSGWAIGSWFIPFFNLVRPKQIVDDAWRSSSPLDDPAHHAPTVINVWWGAWILQLVLLAVAGAVHSDSASSLETHDRLYAIAHGANIVAAVLAIIVVRALTSRVDQVPPPVRTRDQFGMRFNPAPGWPVPPPGWAPPLGWLPDPAWPAAPVNWQFWIQ